jgi:hypothetical protein
MNLGRIKWPLRLAMIGLSIDAISFLFALSVVDSTTSPMIGRVLFSMMVIGICFVFIGVVAGNFLYAKSASSGAFAAMKNLQSKLRNRDRE